MNPNESSDLTAANLVALRNLPEGLEVITERLEVKRMGPADHIRTKHEVKAFIESAGNLADADALLTRARERRTREARVYSNTRTERRGQGISQ